MKIVKQTIYFAVPDDTDVEKFLEEVFPDNDSDPDIAVYEEIWLAPKIDEHNYPDPLPVPEGDSDEEETAFNESCNNWQEYAGQYLSKFKHKET